MRIGGKADELEAVLAKAGESSKNLDATLKKLGNSPIGQEATKSANQLNDVLKQVTDQQQRLAERARLAAGGLESLGGPARLTKDQLDQINVTIQKGIDAFRALGQQAPESLQRMAEAVQAQQKSFQAAGDSVSRFSGLQGTLTSQLAAYAGPAALGFAVKQTLDYADALVKMSDRTGIGVEALQKLEAIAKPSGNTLEEVANAVNKFQKNIAEGDAATTGAIARLGLSFSKLREESPEDQFVDIAKAIQSIKDPAEQTLIAVQLFGRGGAEILPTLKAKVDELKDSTVRLSAESAKALDDLGDNLTRLKTNAENALGGIVAATANLIQNFRDLPGAIKKANDEIRGGGGFQIPGQFQGGKTAAALLGIDLDQLQRQVNQAATVGPLPAAGAPGRDRALGIAIPSNLDQVEAELTKSAQALIALNEQQAAVADRLGLSLDEYQKKLGDVDAKIKLASGDYGALNDAQKAQASNLVALGISQDDVALKLGVSTTAVKNYIDAVKAGATEEQNFMDRMVAMLKIDHDAEQATIALSLAIREHLLPSMTDWGALQAALSGTLQPLASRTLPQATGALVNFQGATDKESQRLRELLQEMRNTTGEGVSLGKVLTSLSGDFAQMAQISNGTFSNIAKDIGLAIKAADQLNKALAISGIGGQAPDKAKPGGIESNAIVGFGSSAAGLGAAAAVGNTLAIASAWVAVGIAVYGVISAISKANQEAAQAAQKLSRVIDLANQFGTTSLFSGSLSDAVETTNTRLDDLATSFARAGNQKALADLFGTKGNQDLTGHLQFLNGTVQKTAEYFGKLHELAASLNLSDIIKELGGVEQLTGAQLVTVQNHFADLFKLISVGGPIAVDATKAMDDALVQFANQAVKSDGFVSNLFLETVRQAKAAGVELAGVNQFIQGQLTRAATGLTTLFAGLDASAKARATAAGQNPDNAGFTVTSQSQGQGLGAAIAGTFAGLRASGTSFRDALTAIQGPLDSLNKALANTGFTGGAAFAGLTAMADIANDKITGPLVDAISGANDAIKGLGNADALTQDSFSALASTATDAYKQIIAQGKSGAAALTIMLPTLQTIWEGEQQFGFKTDDATQALIDQGVASGAIGEKQKSTQNQILDILVKIGQALGADTSAWNVVGDSSAAAAKKAHDKWLSSIGDITTGVDGVQTAIDKITGKTVVIKVDLDTSAADKLKFDLNTIPGGGLTFQSPFTAHTASTGGLVTAMGIQRFAAGGRVLPFMSSGVDTVPILAAPGEIILNAAQQRNIAAVLSSGQQDSHDTYEIHVHTQPGQDPDAIADAVIRKVSQNSNGAGTKLKRGLAAA